MKRFSLLIVLITIGLLHGQISVQRLLDSDGEAGENFGKSVAIHGNYAAITSDYGNSLNGSVLIYEFNGEEWEEYYRITASDGVPWDYFGSSIAMNDEFIVVGAKGVDNNQGAVYFYKKEDVEWLEINKFVTYDSSMDYAKLLGCSVSICDSMVIAGAYRSRFEDNLTGAVYTYKRVGNNWEEAGILTASDGANNDKFGISVDLTKNGSEYKAIIGSPNNQSTGAAYVFANYNGVWTEQAKIQGDSEQNHQYFGSSVEIDDNKAAISTSYSNLNSTSVITYNCNIFGWEEEDVILCDDSDTFGARLLLEDNYLVISDNHGSGIYEPYGGEIFIYKLFDDQWGLLTNIDAYDGHGTDRFGSAICIDGSDIIVGAYGYDYLGSNTGAAYVYDFSDYIEITDVDEKDIEPVKNTLQNYPNPFNPTTTIEYNLSSDERVKLSIYNAKGQLIDILVDDAKSAGTHSANWNANNFSSGIYFYQLTTSTTSTIKKMVLLK